ncbi:MAG TPA: M56 family metallopeptidase, partial [Pyrinomonadaceae bacterium]
MKSVWMLLGQPVFQALGWALVHFIWQGALVALLFAGVTALLRERAAGVRYLTGCAAMLLMLALPVTTAWLIGFSAEGLRTAEQQSGQGSAVGSRLRKTVVAANERVTSPGAVNADEVLPPEAAPLQRWAGEQFASFMPWLVLAWLAGALGLSLRFLGGWLAARRLVLRQTRPLAREWQERSARLARRLNVCGAVRLCESVLTEVPTVIGWVRPVILVPASILTGLSAEQVEALLAHELAHVRRYDYLVNLLQTAVETLLFYHPAVWWVSRRVRVEREHCCDDLAVAACGDVLAYAHALTRLEQLRASCPEPLLMAASGGGSLLQRIRRLIEASPSSSKNSSPLLACLILLLGAGGLFAGARGALLSTGTVAGGVRASSAAESARREVAITFYSVPYMRSQRDDDQTVESTTRKLLKGITSNRIPAVGFVGEKGLYVGDRPEPRTSALKMWLDAGLELGNQTFSHRWLYHTPLEDYERDVVRGEAVTGNLLRERGRGLRYFLYPYLNTGPDLETKAAFEKFLAARGYTFAPVTI